MIKLVIPVIIGFLLDLLLGDPHWFKFHPIRLIGNLISLMEKTLRTLIKKDKKQEFIAGIVLFVVVILVSVLVPGVILYIVYSINKYAGIITEGIMCYFLFATKALKDESMKVYEALKENDIEKSRNAVSMIVGRDTKNLTKEGIIKATIETIAENTSDGVIAPMFYMFIFGACGGFLYKAINTMDSMIGYKNDQYMYFGRFAAKADDVANFIPSRLAALLMIVVSYVLPWFSGKNAFEIYKRDRKKSKSPNSCQTEAVCAGALNISLLGDAYYFGKLYKKESIGDDIEEISIEMIVHTNILLYGTAILGIVVMLGIKYMIISLL